MHLDGFVRGRGRFMITEYIATDEKAGPRFPLLLTTGRILSQYNVGAQTRRTLENVKAILAAGGAGVEDVLMFRVYLTKREDFAEMNEAYGEFIEANVTGGELPCRTTVFVGLPHEVMLVEIDALAVAR